MEYKYIQALYIPSWICCLGESVSIWNNRWTCPGWIFIPHKPHPFSNEYHTIAEGLTNVLFRVEIVEGKDSLTKTSCSLHYYEFHNDCAELPSNLLLLISSKCAIVVKFVVVLFLRSIFGEFVRLCFHSGSKDI